MIKGVFLVVVVGLVFYVIVRLIEREKGIDIICKPLENTTLENISLVLLFLCGPVAWLMAWSRLSWRESS